MMMQMTHIEAGREASSLKYTHYSRPFFLFSKEAHVVIAFLTIS